MPSKNIPISIERFGGLISYKITYSDHQDFYDFTYREDTTKNFLNYF